MRTQGLELGRVTARWLAPALELAALGLCLAGAVWACPAAMRIRGYGPPEPVAVRFPAPPAEKGPASAPADCPASTRCLRDQT